MSSQRYLQTSQNSEPQNSVVRECSDGIAQVVYPGEQYWRETTSIQTLIVWTTPESSLSQPESNFVPVAFEKYWDIISRYEVMKLPEVVQAINVHVLENRGKFFQDVTVVPGKYHLLISYSMYGDGTHLVATRYSQCTGGLVTKSY